MEKQEVGFIVTDEYREWIASIKDKIKRSQIKACCDNAFMVSILY